jgi:iron(III) transport system ATP-binding protein
MTTLIEVEGLTKRFEKDPAVDHLDLEVEEGKIFSLLGPSGCGKTTTLRCIAGLESPDDGDISINETIVTSISKGIFVPPDKRNLGMVFQSYAVWPHLSVYDNVALPLKLRKFNREDERKKTLAALEMVKLTGLEKRRPSQLSGGQQQRVALARAIVYEPRVLLLDEPLSNLDSKLRQSMRFELKELHERLKLTTMYVTHDQEEALILSDTVCVMDKGKIVQNGSPAEIYQKPVNEFVANFVGTSNLLQTTVKNCRLLDGGLKYIRVATANGTELDCGPITQTIPDGTRVSLSIRTEQVKLFEKKPAETLNMFRGKIVESVFLGNRFDLQVQIGQDIIRASSSPNTRSSRGDEAYVVIPPEHCNIINSSS